PIRHMPPYEVLDSEFQNPAAKQRRSCSSISMPGEDVEMIEQYPNDCDNARVWNGQPGHYEAWYLTFNHRPSGMGFWIRYSLDAPLARVGSPYAQLWFAAFDIPKAGALLAPCHVGASAPHHFGGRPGGDAPRRDVLSRTFAVNQKLPIHRMSAAADPFELRIDESVLTHCRAKGRIAGAGHEAQWDLSWDPCPTTHRHLPAFAYQVPGLARTRVLSPNLDVRLGGMVRIDGETLTLSGEPACQSHLWGSKHADAWAWGHCNAFDDRDDAVLESLTVGLSPAGVALPSLTFLSLRLDGETLIFTSPIDVVRTSGHFGTARYRFAAADARARISGVFSCHPDEMVTAEYADPDGTRSYCANTEIASLRIDVYRRSSWRSRWLEQARLVATGTAHFEVAGRIPDQAVARRHTPV
ncbi:MAG: hypothetical protein V2A73_14925, partial [Pseudomonadota bacterium]